MRFVVHVSIPPERFNDAVLDGTAGQKMAKILEETKPEAAYFCAQDGNRGGFLIVNMESVSDMPRLAEPWFITFNASVQFLPAMTAEDLQKARLDEIGKRWK